MESIEALEELLCALVSGCCSSEIWERGAIAHYASVEFETARVKLVRAAINAGEWQWPYVPLALLSEAIVIQASLDEHNTENKFRTYQAIVWGLDKNSHGQRVTVSALNLEIAKQKLESAYGVGNIFDLHNADDDQKVR